MYVADVAANRVLRYPPAPPSGTGTIHIFGANPDNAPRGPSTLFRPQGVAVQGSDLIVADTGDHRLLRFSNLGRAAVPAADAVFGQAGFTSFLPNDGSPAMPLASAQSLASPMQAAFGPNRELFIAGTGNNRVLAVPQAGGRYPQAARVLGQSGFTQTAPNRSLDTSLYNSTSALAGASLTRRIGPRTEALLRYQYAFYNFQTGPLRDFGRHQIAVGVMYYFHDPPDR